MKLLTRFYLIILLVVSTVSLSAKSAKDLTATDFFKNADYSSLQLSPNGEYLAALIPVKDRSNIIVMKSDNLGDYQFLTGFTDTQVQSFFWKGNDRIVFTMDNSDGGEAFGLYTVKREKNAEIVTLLDSYRKGKSIISANVVHHLPDDNNHIIVAYNKRYVKVPDLYKLAVDSKWNYRVERNRSMQLIAKNPGDVQGWIVDNDGDVRGAVSTKGLINKFLYKGKNEEHFKVLQEGRFDSEGITPLAFAFDNKMMYVSSNVGRDKQAIYTFDPVKNELGEMIYGKDDVDVSDLIMSRKKQKLTGIAYQDEYPHRVYFDQQEKALDAAFQKAFPGKIVATTSLSKDESMRVLYVGSDRDPGTYYLFNSTKKKLSKLTARAPQIDPSLMSEMKPFEFESRDGLTLRGYVTIPKNAVGKVPLIINPHGGPYGVRDGWGYKPDTQFLASRGYAVAQVNFRGSGGYGRKFENAGFGAKWGAEMQNDVTDTVQYLIKEGIADADHVCIYGGSYGGYATMAGLTFTPDLYKCGINNVGVTDVGLLFSSLRQDWESAREQFSVQVGDPENKELMKRMSPIDHVDQIKAPVFIIHGKKDPRVVFKHATMLKDKLDDLDKPYKWLVEDKEGHGFRKQENRINMFEQIEKFLEENI